MSFLTILHFPAVLLKVQGVLAVKITSSIICKTATNCTKFKLGGVVKGQQL